MTTFLVMIVGWAVMLAVLSRNAQFRVRDVAGAVILAGAWFFFCVSILERA